MRRSVWRRGPTQGRRGSEQAAAASAACRLTLRVAWLGVAALRRLCISAGIEGSGFRGGLSFDDGASTRSSAPALHGLLTTHLPPGGLAAANRQAAAAHCTGLALHGCCSRPCEPLAGSCLQQS